MGIKKSTLIIQTSFAILVIITAVLYVYGIIPYSLFGLASGCLIGSFIIGALEIRKYLKSKKLLKIKDS